MLRMTHVLGGSKHMTKPTHTGFTSAELGAIQRFLTSCTVPLIYQTDDGAIVEGTGFFYRHGSAKLLITAAHVFVGHDVNRFGIPERPGGNAFVWHLGAAMLHHPVKHEQHDVAVVQLHDGDLARAAEAGWFFFGDSNVATEPLGATDYVIAGYPTKTVAERDGQLVPTALTQIYTRTYDGPVDDSRSEFDLLLSYGRQASGLFGGLKSTPELGGISGAAVLAVSRAPSEVWTPDRVLKLAGVEVSCFHSKYIRAKTWALVAHIFRSLQEQGHISLTTTSCAR